MKAQDKKVHKKKKSGRPSKGVQRVVFSMEKDLLLKLMSAHDGSYGYLSMMINGLLRKALK